MQKLLPSLLVSLLLLLGACALPETTAQSPAPATAVSQVAATPLQPEPSASVSEPATGQVASTPAGQALPEATKKPNGQKTPSAEKPQSKNPPVAPTSANPNFVAPEISGRPTDTSLTINIVPAVEMQVVIAYGTQTGNYSLQTNPVTLAANSPQEIELTNLTPDTEYFYTVLANGAPGLEHSFHTARAPGSAFTFDIQGDSHPERTKNQFDAKLYTRTLTGAASDQPDFYLAIGDDFSVDTLKNVNAQAVTQLYVSQRQWLGLVGAPVFLVNGNHEQAALANLDGTAENVAVWAQTARNAYYPQPAPDAFYTGDAESVEFIGQLRDYYAFTWGDALFVVIDPYWHSKVTVDNTFGDGKAQPGGQKGKRDLWEVTLGEAQYQWFKETLAGSGAKYKFVFTHHVLGTGRGGIELANSFEWGDAANLAAHRPGWDKTIQEVMAENHVTIFFQGHDHIFVKQELDGVIYQTLPEPANPFYSWENADAYRSGDKFPNSGRVRVSVAPEGVKVEYIRSYLDQPDEIAFSYTVP
jgi:hypothetical protein